LRNDLVFVLAPAETLLALAKLKVGSSILPISILKHTRPSLFYTADRNDRGLNCLCDIPLRNGEGQSATV